MQLPRPVYRIAWAGHRLLDRVSGGRLGRHFGKTPVLWLTTVGRRTGTVRTNALLFLEHGDAWVVAATNAASEREPAWLANVLAHPDTEARWGTERRLVHARRAEPHEERYLWPALDEIYPAYRTYRQQLMRAVPLIVLERREP